MGKYKIFVDGSAGTTGLRIADRLAERDEFEILQISEADRKDVRARAVVINESDLSFLCLPDDAARVAVPGCHATGFIAPVAPLVERGLILKAAHLSVTSLTGYSGGGKKMIAEIESPDRAPELYSPRFYGLANNHKHLPEMQKISGLEKKPMFTPIVDDYYNGMVVCVPIQAAISGFSLEPERVQEMLERHYAGSNFVHVQPLKTPAEMTATKLSCNDLRDTNQMEIFVFGDAEQILLCSRLDNLGKGASGAAVQCMNIMLGLDETVGLL